MGLDNSAFGYSNFKQLLEKIVIFINEHLPEKFFSNKLIHSTKWKYDYIVCKKKKKKKKIEDTDKHFKRTKTINFDIIKNVVLKDKLVQYQ